MKSETNAQRAQMTDWSSIQSVVETSQGSATERGDTPPVHGRCWATARTPADEALLATVPDSEAASHAPCPAHGNRGCSTGTPGQHGDDSPPPTEERMSSLRLLAAIDRVSDGAALSANRVAFTICEATTNVWPKLADDSTQHDGPANLPAINESVLFDGDRWQQTAVRASRKRLLDRSAVPGYADYSTQLGYTHNVGTHAIVHVAWTGWYIMTSGGPGGVPLTRARRIGDLELLGFANWAGLRAFEHPDLSGLAAGIRAVLQRDNWADDAALVSALWSAQYADLKRKRQDNGQWPRHVPAYRHDRYGWLQEIENVALGAVRLVAEHGAPWRDVVDLSVLWRRTNDILDVVTDIVSGEANNGAAVLLRARLAQGPYDRARAAGELMHYHRETVVLRNELLARSGGSVLRRQMTMAVAMWYVWMGRYNIWHKYLLARRYLTVPGVTLPAVSWEQVDIDHVRAVYARCGAGCADALVQLAGQGTRSGPAVPPMGPATQRLYTALVCGVEGIELCARRDCDCSDRLAEYLDAELGGEYCQWVAEMVREDRDKTDIYQMLSDFIDSEAFSIYAIGAYASGYMAPELLQLPTGSRFDDSTRKSWL